MRAVTWTQVAQYIVLIVAYLVPVIWMSNKQGFGIIPHFGYGEAVARIGELETLHGIGELKPTEKFAGLKALTVKHAPCQRQRFGQLEICHTGVVHDVGDGLPAPYLNALFHHAVRSCRSPIGRLVFVLYFLVVFHRTGLGHFNQVTSVRPGIGHRYYWKGHRRCGIVGMGAKMVGSRILKSIGQQRRRTLTN